MGTRGRQVVEDVLSPDRTRKPKTEGPAMTLVTFIIPVRHQDNARDWNSLKANLVQTVNSIANQTNPDWRGIIVANEGADLPDLPDGFSVERVTFPPNQMHERKDSALEDFRDAFRIDKGRRVLAAMLRARDSRFFMIVDDDDFVSARIVDYVAEHPDENGFVLNRGYMWDHGGRILLGLEDFNDFCGTSLIVRSDVYGLPARFEDASPEWIKSMLGSHRSITGILEKQGTPLVPLPFHGAIYRVAHAGSHSGYPGLLGHSFLNWNAIRRPRKLLRSALRLRLVGTAARREFFGERADRSPG